MDKKVRYRNMFSRCLIFSLALMVTCVYLINSGIASQPDDDERLEQGALKIAADQNDLPYNTLEIVNSADLEFKLQGKKATHYKVIDKRTGELYGVSVDMNGNSIDLERSMADEETAYISKYGKKHPAFAEKMKVHPAGNKKTIPSIIWITESASEGPQRPVPGTDMIRQKDVFEKMEALHEQINKERSARVEHITRPAADRLREQGIDIKIDRTSPVIFADLTVEQINQVEQMDSVSRLYLNSFAQPSLNVVRPAIKANIVHDRGIKGLNIKVGEIEVGGQITNINPYLSGIIQDRKYSCISGHSTGVAGIIRSVHPSYTGIAPKSTLWVGGSCSGLYSEIMNRSTAAKDWGARVISLSLAGNTNSLEPDALDKFYDDMVFNTYQTVVVAAGNLGNSNGYIGSPGKAYNVMTVGASDDKNTKTWSDDIIAPYSSYVDPLSSHNDREKPEVTAPGTNIISTTTAYPWIGSIGSGTSYATPVVTGEVALIMERDPSLQFWPESVKAIIMASAVHNIENNTRLSEKDGAGEISADVADNITRKVNGNWGGISYSCSSPTALELNNMSLTANVITRAVIAWNNNPGDTSSYRLQPTADLDLRILDRSGVVVATSASYDNNYEIVEFKPLTSGIYRLQVYKYRCSLTPKWLGWAWEKGN